MRAAVLFFLGACAVVDGTAGVDRASGKVCATDLDCGRGRYCSAGLCAVDCARGSDCPSNTCSPCGRCVSTRDTSCLQPTDQPCAADAECGAGYACHDGICAQRCESDEGCSLRGFACGETKLCVRTCVREDDCKHHGWKYVCRLPDGVDPQKNADAESPVRGRCALDENALGFAGTSPYEGIWGFLAASAVRVDGVPLLTRLNSVNVQHMLVKVSAEGPDLVLRFKWCSNVVKAFSETDGKVVELFKVLTPDRNVDSIDVVSIRAPAAPAMKPGASFVTSELLDLRGARLADPTGDPLPTYKSLTGQRDQDRDKKPGMTANVTGALTGELYQAQRTRATFHAMVVDTSHMHGLLTGSAEATVLGASTQELINDAVTSQHPHADRTYFRALRLSDDASCADVIRIAQTEGSWIMHQDHFDAARKP